MRLILTLAFILFTPSAFAVDFDSLEAIEYIKQFLSGVGEFVFLPVLYLLFKIFILYGVVGLALVLFILLLRLTIDKEKLDKSSYYIIALRILNFGFGVFKFFLGPVSLGFGFYIAALLVAAVIASFFLASAIDKEKNMSDAKIAAYINAPDFIHRATLYKADMLQLQRKYAYEYKNADFLRCLKQDMKLEINMKTKKVVDRNQLNFSRCAKEHIGVEEIKFAEIPYDSSLSVESNLKLLSIIDDSVHLAHAFIRNTCAKKDFNVDKHRYLSQCSQMKDNVVITTGSDDLVLPMEATEISKETIDKAIDIFVARYVDVSLAEVESYLDKKQAELTEMIEKKLKSKSVGVLDILYATFQSVSIVSEVDKAIGKFTIPASIKINLSVIQNNTAEKFRYRASGGKKEDAQDTYKIKTEIVRYFTIYQRGENFIAGMAAGYVNSKFNSFTNNAFSKFGFSGNDECIYDHSKCKIASMNLATQNIAIGTKGVADHFSKAISLNIQIIGLETLGSTQNLKTYTDPVIQFMKIRLKFEMFLFFISLMLIIYVISRVFFSQFGNFVYLGKRFAVWQVAIIPETISKSLGKELDRGEFKLELNYPIYFMTFPVMITVSFIYGLFLMGIGATIAAMVAPIIIASIIPAGLEIIAEPAIYIFFYVMMGFLFNKTLGAMDKEFLTEFTNSLIGKADKFITELADNVHNKLTHMMNSSK
ncbi:TPA: hypothetical protein ACXK4S_000670 [Pseudomonas aeruginosa]